eukprot:1151946-Rhodomonas_salina.2
MSGTELVYDATRQQSAPHVGGDRHSGTTLLTCHILLRAARYSREVAPDAMSGTHVRDAA